MNTTQEASVAPHTPAPINIELMDVDDFVKKNHCLPVSTVLIRQTSTRQFHPEGLFSETIFGQIGTPERFTRFGYIDLNTTILHPIIYENIKRVKAFYIEIMAGKQYARWNDKDKTFDRCNMDDDDADTGYKFFMDHVKDLKFEKNESRTHNEKVDVIDKNKDKAIMSKCLVMVCALRDMREDEAKPESDSINTLYRSLINYTKAIPMRNGNNRVYDGLRFRIQKQVNTIYDYIFSMCQGKFGFFQRKLSSRGLALGTRNVIATTPMNAYSPTDSQFFKIDEMKVPLFQCAHMFMPLVVYYIKELFFSDVFNMSADQVAVIDPETLQLRYQPITEEEKTKFLSSEGIHNLVSLFRDEIYQKQPVVVYNEEELPFYLYLVYDDKDTVFIGRNISELEEMCHNHGLFFRKDKARPLTYVEMLYIAVYCATENRTGLVCRYPAIELGSNVPCKIHVYTTNPARKVVLYQYPKLDIGKALPEYPIMEKNVGSVCLPNPSLLSGLGADHHPSRSAQGVILVK